MYATCFNDVFCEYHEIKKISLFYLDISFGQKLGTKVQLVDYIWTELQKATLQQQK